MNALMVFIGGGAGSLLRFAFAVMARRVFATGFPIGTLLANLLASFFLVIFVYVLKDKFSNPSLYFLVVTGFCGGFSTFSTFSYESMLLFQEGNLWMAVANVVLNVAACLLAVGLVMR